MTTQSSVQFWVTALPSLPHRGFAAAGVAIAAKTENVVIFPDQNIILTLLNSFAAAPFGLGASTPGPPVCRDLRRAPLASP